MSRLSELIAEHCPNGVEYKPLEEVATSFTRGSGIKREEVTADGVPCVRYGEIYTTYDIGFDTCISHTTVEVAKRAKCFEHGDILFAITGEKIEDIAKCTAYLGHDKCYAGGDVVVMKHEQNPKYLVYALSTKEAQRQKSKGKVKSKVVHSSVPALKSIVIPLPPIEVQNEIVRILDAYTQEVGELIDELEAELTARRKQYEHYRDRLLSCAGIKSDQKILGNVAKYSKERISMSHVTSENYVSVETLQQDRQGRILATAIPSGQPFIGYHVGDILIGNIRPYLKKIWLADCCGGTNGDVLVVRIINSEDVTPRFLYHVLASDRFFLYASRKIKAGKMPRGDKKAIMKYVFRLPNTTEQEKIVSILDKFDALCNDETAGLAAEIAARKKQYEYYRDRLLNFKRQEEVGNVNSTRRKKRNSPRKGGGYYTEDGMERLKRSGMKGHEAAERLIAEQIGERHRLLRPLTREAAGILKSVKGMIPRALFLSNAIVREAERRAKKEKT